MWLYSHYPDLFLVLACVNAHLIASRLMFLKTKCYKLKDWMRKLQLKSQILFLCEGLLKALNLITRVVTNFFFFFSNVMILNLDGRVDSDAVTLLSLNAYKNIYLLLFNMLILSL